MFMSVIWTLLSLIGKILLKILIPIGIIFSVIVIFILSNLFYYRFIKKMKFRKSQFTGNREKKSNFLKKLLIEFPNRLSLDLIEKDPDAFTPFGIHMVCGEQGSGKTVTVCYLLQEWKKQFPLMKIYTNMNYQLEDGPINHWQDIVNKNNGIYGTAKVLDEVQTWFTSEESRNFRVEMLSEVSQQRKQRSCIIGTSQLFNRMGKPLREQTHFIYLPMTLLGCLTIVRKSHVKYWNDEKQIFTRYTGLFFFIHTKKMRDSFDTYKKIEKYSEEGFYYNEQMNSSSDLSPRINIVNKK